MSSLEHIVSVNGDAVPIVVAVVVGYLMVVSFFTLLSKSFDWF